MKVQNHPSAWGVLAGMLVLLLALVANVSCGSAPPRANPAFQKHRDPRAVAVQAVCLTANGLMGANGSGVILDERRVLSANHVADWCPLPIITVETEDKRTFQMRVARRWADRDIMELVLLAPGDRFAVAPLKIAAPKGELCASTAFPNRVAACGKFKSTHATQCPLTKSSDTNRWCHNFTIDTVIVSGNSGSAIYDENMNLVGLVTGGSIVETYATELYSLRGEFR